MNLAILGLGVSAACLLVLWAVGRRHDTPGRRRTLKVLATLVLALTGLVVVRLARMAIVEHRLDHVASEVSGVPATVHCQHSWQTPSFARRDLGYVRVIDGAPERSTFIKNSECVLMAEYATGDQSHPRLSEVVAVHVLTHESMHMVGISSEAGAECAAMQNDARTAMLFGASEKEARALARRYWRTVYPLMPAEYVTDDCRPGGPLDDHLGYGPWGPTP